MAKNVVVDTPETADPSHFLVLRDGEVARLPAPDMGIAAVSGLQTALDAKASSASVVDLAAAAAADAVAAGLPARISSPQLADPIGTDIVGLAPVDVATIAAAKGISSSERAKLTGIESGAQVNPPRITLEQVAVSTDTSIVSVAPADLAAVASMHALGAIVGGDLIDAGSEDPLPVTGGDLIDAL